jgi:hypothetical protein
VSATDRSPSLIARPRCPSNDSVHSLNIRWLVGGAASNFGSMSELGRKFLEDHCSRVGVG